MLKKTVLLLLGVLLNVSSWAQSVDVTGQLRHRFERNGKSFEKAVAGDLFSLQRTRLNLLFQSSTKVSVFFQLQDSRVWGSENGTMDGSASAIDLHQGYVAISNFLCQDLSVKFGRLEMSYGNQRLVGAVGWSNIGRSFDGIVFNYKKSKLNLNLWETKIKEDNLTVTKDTDHYFFGSFGQYNWSQNWKSDFWLLYDLDRDSVRAGPDLGKNRLSRLTGGLAENFNYRSLSLSFEASYQLGKIESDSTNRNDIKAYLLSGQIGYSFAGKMKPWIGLGVDQLSGDKNNADGSYRVFNTLYATNHKFYGFMDYFTNIPTHTSNRGLRDYMIRGKLNPQTSLQIALDFHRFSLGNKVGLSSDELGSELDLTVKYLYDKKVTFQSGLSMFFPGDVFPDAERSSWFYLMTVVNF